MTDVAEWLQAIGLPEYAQRFAENAIDVSVLRDLTDQDLKDLGILLGHRRKMLRAIAELQTAPRTLATTTTETAPPKEAERRHLTLMFCDLVGSTALSARLDPEDMQSVIGAYYTCLAEVIGRYQGTIARFLGDGALVYFGYPQAHEDDAEQAVRAALALTDAVSRLRTVADTQLCTRIGIATGVTVVGSLIGQGAVQYQATAGETPNLAARLQTLAQPGAVLICPNTRRLTGGQFDYRDLGHVELKGWSDPVQVWQVLGPSGVESRFEAMHSARVPPPFGREEELDLLSNRWRRASQEEGQVVVLTGEPGIGKSHVAFTFAEGLHGEAHVVLRYFCSAHHTNSVLYPIIAQLERAAGFEHGDTPADKLAKIHDLVLQAAEDPEQVAVLANLMGLPESERYPLHELTPQQRKEKTFAALLAQLRSLAARQPVLLIFEDVHWMDPTSLELLAATVERVPRLRALVVITARPEFVPPWPSYSHTTTMPLSRLGRRYGAALVERVAGGRALPEDLLDEILARTDGVPLFIEELTKTVLESDLLDERNGQYVLDRPLPSFAIPDTLHASLMARLDRLAAVRDVAQIGAVAGREFHFELLRAVSGLARARLEEALEQLVRSELVFRRGETPDAVYIFKHALVRDAAYAGLLKTRRAQLHGAIASALEQHFPAVVQGQPETLGRHFTEAGQAERAIAYWLQAGKNAALRSANLEAIAHLQRGIELAARLPAGRTTDRSELDLQLILGPCLSARHGPTSSDALGAFARARELCERLGQPPEYLQVMFSLVTGSVMRGELSQALEALAGLPSAAEARGNRPALINGIRGQAMILMFMGRLVEAREALERVAQLFGSATEAERIATRSAGQDAGVSMLVLDAWVIWTLGQADEAVSRIAAALDRADTVAHAHTHAYAWYYASVLHALRGEPSIAAGYAERCLAISEQHGFRHWLGLSRALRGICATLMDPSVEALEVTNSLDEYQRAGFQLGLTAQFVLLCPALLSRNRPDAALTLIDQGLAIAGKNEERFFAAELYRLKAKALLMRGASIEEARGLLDEALRTARGQQARSLELRAATDLARLWMSEGKRAQAFDGLSSVYGRFTEGFATRDLEEAKGVLGQLLETLA